MPDVPLAARMLVTTIESVVHRFMGRATPAGLDRLEDELVAMLFSYLTADGPASLE
ncbi:hypothetical protein ACFQ07_15725 [Actinomadura adrarensis]|uniref:Tetracyclin repressor SlmA-like C-terminal domain-containing protein n=1 Tax=Actinomadura adrarensis TaxID=1819600 RepID=A0ABW3CIT1_9ACTN